MQHYTTVDSIVSYLQYAESLGVSQQSVFKKAGVAKSVLQSRHGYVDESILIQVLLAIEELGKDPLLGLRQAKHIQANSFDILGYVALNCDNLQQSIEKVILYEGTVGNLGYTQIIPVQDNILISWCCEIKEPRVKRHSLESVMARWTVYARELVKLDENAKAVWFEHSAPENPEVLREYQSLLQCPVFFNQPYTGVLVTEAQWQMPFPQANPSLRRAFEANAQVILKKFQQLLAGAQGFSQQTKRVLRNMQRSGIQFNKAEVATHFGMSLRTLQRHLEKENNSYNGLVEEVRMERAIELLQLTAISTSEIATQLGYTEVRSFYRALKKWTGKTASEIRRQYN